MAKVRFFNVVIRNGHSDWVEFVPAHSGSNAASYFLSNPDHKIVNVQFIGWFDVAIHYNGHEFSFHTFDANFDSDSIGYDYLMQQLHTDLQTFISQMQSKDHYP